MRPMRNSVRSFFQLLFFLISSSASAQDTTAAVGVQDTSGVVISSIIITGNKRTKNFIILREIKFKAGDIIRRDVLAANLKQSRTQVYNTNLFTEVKVDSAVLADSSLQVNVMVKEKWYIYPTPQFQLADRSFNEWIKLHNANLNRVIYGLKFAHYNFSGRRDQLKVYLLNGYARNFSMSYNNPSVNAALTKGVGFATGFTQNREIGYKINSFNRILFFRKPGFVRNSFVFSVGHNVRKGFFKSSGVGFNLYHINVHDSVLTSKYNPYYFNNSRSRTQFFPEISFAVGYTNTDNNNYPLKGMSYGYGLSKRGTGFTGGINATTVSGSISKFITHRKNWYSTLQASALVKVPFNQAFINLSGIGLRGLEYYAVNGVANTTLKYTLSKKVAEFRLPIPFKIKALPYVPFKFFAKTYTDAGYSYTPSQFNTRFNNRMLHTGGFGVDILTLYDIVLKVEYSFNQLGEKGIFLHGSGGF